MLDKVADRRDRLEKEAKEAALSSQSEAVLTASEEFARNTVSDINTVLETAQEVAFLSGSSRKTQVMNLRRMIVFCAAKMVGPGSRATYYALAGTAPSRILGDPIHAANYGRDDRPDKPFEESVDPDLEVWALIDRADTEPQVHHRGEKVHKLDWDRKAYSAYLSVPVKAKSICYGMLSVNTANPEALGGAQRAAVIAMARVMGLVEAMELGPTKATAANTQAIVGGSA